MCVGKGTAKEPHFRARFDNNINVFMLIFADINVLMLIFATLAVRSRGLRSMQILICCSLIQ